MYFSLFLCILQIGNDNFNDVLSKVGGPSAIEEWSNLQTLMRPLATAATMLPPLAIRYDPAVMISAIGRYLPSLLSSGTAGLKLAGKRPARI